MSEPKRPAPLLLERYLLGALDDDEKRTFEARWSPEERARWVAEHEALRMELLSRTSAPEFAERVQRRRAGEKERRRVPAVHALAWGALVACLGFLGHAVLPTTPEDRATHEMAAEPKERAKGLVPALRVYRKTSSGSERLRDQATVQVGDTLQLSYLAPGMRHGVIVAMDGLGQVTPLFPREPGGSTLLPTESGEHFLDLAYELDDAPDFERFVLVTSESAFEAEVVLSAARHLAESSRDARTQPLPLAPGLTQTSFVVRKGGR